LNDYLKPGGLAANIQVPVWDDAWRLMMKATLAAAAIVLLLPTIAVGSSGTTVPVVPDQPAREEQRAMPSATLPPALARVLTDYESAWQARDARALAALFTDDGFVLANGVPPVRGRAAIEKHYTGQGGPLFLRALAYSTEGSTGYIIGGFARQQGEPDIGKFTLTLRKGADGRWLIMSDMDNGNSRP
jgi:ketosteroid isomerase-like protein